MTKRDLLSTATVFLEAGYLEVLSSGQRLLEKKILTYAKSRTTRICVLPPEEQKSLFPLVDQLLSFQNIQRLRFVHNLSNEGINDDDDDDDDDGGGV